MFKWLREDIDFPMPRWWWFAVAYLIFYAAIDSIISLVT